MRRIEQLAGSFIEEVHCILILHVLTEIVSRCRKNSSAVVIIDIAPVYPAVDNLIFRELPQQPAILVHRQHFGIIASAAVLAHQKTVGIGIDIVFLIDCDMHHGRIGTLRSIRADEISTLILPTDIPCVHINGVKPALRALLAYYRQLAVRRKTQRNQLTYAKGAFPFLASLVVEEEELATLRSDNPAFFFSGVAHHRLGKAHAVIILRRDITQIDAHAGAVVINMKLVPWRSAAGNPVQCAPGKQQQHKCQPAF